MERECNSVAHYADSSRQAAAEGLPLESFFFFLLLITYYLFLKFYTQGLLQPRLALNSLLLRLTLNVCS